jgi:hypothetical protein
MMKILIRVSINENNVNWPKKKPYGLLNKAVKSKVIFSVYLSIENGKGNFCCINLVRSSRKSWNLSIEKIDRFLFFGAQKFVVDQKEIHASEMMSNQFGVRFKMFLIVELTLLGGQNFKLDLELLTLMLKGQLEPLH